MKKKPSLNDELTMTLIMGILGFCIIMILSSCSTSSRMACDSLLGEDKDKCLEEYKVMESQMRQREIMGGR